MTTIHNGLESSLALSSGSTGETRTAQAGAANSSSHTQQNTGSGGAASEVQITSTAQLMASLEQQIAGTPDIDQSRVDSVSQSLGDGSYQPDAGRIADGVLSAQKFDAQASAGPASAPQSGASRAFTATARLGSDRG